ncbi:cupin domain-containing protein [bacterium]|nr:cupin domain-containing protein [bacterium]
MGIVFGQAMDLNILVDYQADAVVSKILLDKKIGNITIFAFAQGQGLSEHTSPYDAFVHVLDGEAEITIEGKPHNVTAGRVMIMPANHPHALKARKPFKMMLIMIREKAEV